MSARTLATVWLHTPQPITLQQAAEHLADEMGAASPRLIERRLANQDYDLYYRIRQQGLEVELRSRSWQVDEPVQCFRIDGLPTDDPRWPPLISALGWAVE